MQFTTIQQVKKYLDQFIQPPGGLGDGMHNFGRMQELMRLLGDPQDSLRVVHVAGTSGKGSTCHIISSVLRAHGFRVGLTVSPHILDLRERTQINNQMLTIKDYCRYLSELVPAIESTRQSCYGAPSFFEITMAHAFYTFYKEKVDYAVIETGLGGRYDASNVVTRADKLAIITRIGLDHMDFLGDTIAKIAEEKAHIIKKGNRVLSVPQDEEAKEVIERVAAQHEASLKFVEMQPAIKTSLKGTYQKENSSVALAAVYELSKRDTFTYDQQKIRYTLQHIHFIGRFDAREVGGKTVILDGAHNPQKMEAFISSLEMEYAEQKFHFLIAFRKGKEYRKMLKYIIPHAQHITITEFDMGDQGMHGTAESTSIIEKGIYDLGFSAKSGSASGGKNYESNSDPQKAFKQALKKADDVLVVTGSFYLLSNLYSTIAELKD